MTVDAYRQDLDLLFFLLAKEIFQLAELLGAVGSPLPAVEDQDKTLFAAIIGERDRLTVHAFEGKIGRRAADFDPLEIGRA